jgi:hypothetical protein
LDRSQIEELDDFLNDKEKLARVLVDYKIHPNNKLSNQIDKKLLDYLDKDVKSYLNIL